MDCWRKLGQASEAIGDSEVTVSDDRSEERTQGPVSGV